MLQDISLFEIQKLGEGFSLVCNNGEVKVNGDLIERQFQFFDKYLIFVSDNIAFEMGVYIYYLDKSLKVLDYIEISNAYATDNFKVLKINQPNNLQFSFLLKEAFWNLTLLPKSKLSFEFSNHLIKRKNRFLNYVFLDLKKKTSTNDL